ncbi:uncharacterized protein LAESUDRAFT_763622 [Laetiporus sulphureus 93-53]|uniref:Uncharacterized protein n=1 Tax=Laetiporus sulphureus 93-53 TaxID=1314785 RepID=A0A165BTJ4_9APHY|nr:uncharacterized protein LAESUDRAFT_763622 [Laetiporus sulphureus 93-53]KZT01623.1 hypothetical protein LAESUDRAFT_763622 [Laetiporus sulphureus 93-53]
MQQRANHSLATSPVKSARSRQCPHGTLPSRGFTEPGRGRARSHGAIQRRVPDLRALLPPAPGFLGGPPARAPSPIGCSPPPREILRPHTDLKASRLELSVIEFHSAARPRLQATTIISDVSTMISAHRFAGAHCLSIVCARAATRAAIARKGRLRAGTPLVSQHAYA